MNNDLLKNAKADLQQSLDQLNNMSYPAQPSPNAATIVLYARLMALEEKLEKLTQSLKLSDR